MDELEYFQFYSILIFVYKQSHYEQTSIYAVFYNNILLRYVIQNLIISLRYIPRNKISIPTCSHFDTYG